MRGQLQEIFLEFLQNYQISSFEPHIFLLPDQKKIVYRCAIALQLGARNSDSPIIWAKKLYQDYLAHQAGGFDIKIQPDGSLDCCPRPVLVKEWLDTFQIHWGEISTHLDKSINLKRYPNFNPFLCQYVHARCCSLRRLAFQEKMIDANTVIPWLSSCDTLNLSTIQEWALLRQLIQTSDRLEIASAKVLLKLTRALREAFLLFERDCRIFGEVAQKTPHIAQVRLGLVRITELMLKDLLVKGFNIEAPREL